MIILGAVLIAWPLLWSAKTNYLQIREQREWRDHRIRHGDPRFKIIIPKIGLDAVVVEEVTESDLDRGPMHVAGTAFPGEPGNCCIAAHKEKWFRHLRDLVRGDKVEIEMVDKTYVYVIIGSKIVRDDRTEVLMDGPGATISLITCVGPSYFGRGHGRIVYVGSLKTIK